MKNEHFSTEKPSARPQAVPKSTGAVSRKRRPPLPWPWALALFAILLILPIWAAVDLSQRFDWRFVVTYFALISGLTFAFYWSDKRKAQHDQWRIPEGTLHLLELLGGWPAGLLAQRFLRHKTKKVSYQFAFWFIVALHELISFEFVSNWWFSRLIWQAIQQ